VSGRCDVGVYIGHSERVATAVVVVAAAAMATVAAAVTLGLSHPIFLHCSHGHPIFLCHGHLTVFSSGHPSVLAHGLTTHLVVATHRSVVLRRLSRLLSGARDGARLQQR
jgi:hypothetical protein